MPQPKSDLSKLTDLLDRQSAILDKREIQLEKDERAFYDKVALQPELEKRLEIVNKQVAIREIALSEVNKKLDTARAKQEQLVSEHKQELARLDAIISNREDQAVNLTAKSEEMLESIRKLKHERAELQRENKEQQDYIKHQETVVEETISEWNTRLNEFQAEGTKLEEDKRKLLTDLVRLEQQTKVAKEDLEAVQESIVSTSDHHTAQEAEHMRKIQAIDVDYNNRKNQLDELEVRIGAKEKGLSTREKSLRLQEIAQKNRENELDQKERYLNSRISLT